MKVSNYSIPVHLLSTISSTHVHALMVTTTKSYKPFYQLKAMYSTGNVLLRLYGCLTHRTRASMMRAIKLSLSVTYAAKNFTKLAGAHNVNIELH